MEDDDEQSAIEDFLQVSNQTNKKTTMKLNSNFHVSIFIYCRFWKSIVKIVNNKANMSRLK